MSLPTALGLLATSMGAFGFWQFTEAAPSFPDRVYGGWIEVAFDGEAPSALNVEVQHFPKGQMMIVHFTSPSKSCVRAEVTVTGAPASSMLINGVEAFKTNTPNMITREPVDKLLEVCAEGSLTFWLNRPLITTSGAVTRVSFPDFTFYGVPRGSDINATWEIILGSEATENLGQMKPEIMSTGYTGSGFKWRTKATESWQPEGDRDLEAPSGTYIAIDKERSANRALFWAGLLTGSAVSLYAWSAEVWLERRRAKRNDAPEAAVTAEHVAMQVVQLLDQRKATEEDRRSNKWWMRLEGQPESQEYKE